MSTRINGYVARGVSITQMVDLLCSLKTLVETTAISELSTYMAKQILNRVDYGGEFPRSAMAMVSREVRKRHDEVRSRGRRDVDVDFDNSVTLFIKDHDIYLIPYIENTAVRRVFRAQPWLEDFSFHDATDDIPDGETWETYQARRQDWDEIIGPTGVPADRGLSFQLSASSFVYYQVTPQSIQDAISAIPDEDRKTDCARRRIAARFLPTEFNAVSEVIAKIAESNEYMASSAGVDEIEKLKEEIILPTIDLVKGGSK